MTPSQLRQWSFQNSQPDQWWLCLDGVTEEVPVTVAEIESLLASGDYSQAQALHTSHAEIVNPAWIYLTVPATVATPPSVDSALAALSQSAKAQNAPTNAQANTPNKDMQQGCLALIGLVAFLFVIFKGFSWMTGEQSSSDDVPVRQANENWEREYAQPQRSARAMQSASNAWYEGGTLASGGATMAEWKRATYENRLASSADFVARSIGGNLNNLDMDDDIKPMAERLELEISAAYQVGVTDNVSVHEIAAGCITILKAQGQWLR
jgi:hypothetical protein